MPTLNLELILSQLKKSKASILGQMNFKITFYNLASQNWEPVVEQFSFILAQRETQQEKTTLFNLDINHTKELRLNFTEEFVSIFPTLNQFFLTQ